MDAEVKATKRNLLGQREEIAMRAIQENGRVSYFSTFGIALPGNFRVTISAQPPGSSAPM